MRVNLQPVYYTIRSPYLRPKKKYIYTEQDVINDVFQIVFDVFRINKILITSRKRHRPIVIARQVSACLIRSFTNSTLKQTGLYLGGVDHSSILYALRQIPDLILWDKVLEEQFNNCMRYMASKHKQINC